MRQKPKEGILNILKNGKCGFERLCEILGSPHNLTYDTYFRKEIADAVKELLEEEKIDVHVDRWGVATYILKKGGKIMASDECEFLCNVCGHTWTKLKSNIKKNGWPKQCPNRGCTDFGCGCGSTSATGCKCDDCKGNAASCSSDCGDCACGCGGGENCICDDSCDKAKENAKRYMPKPTTSGQRPRTRINLNKKKKGGGGCGGCGTKISSG
ncbi:hypothetical protein KJ885_03540 [Patescibacteria group bacterium]|nr:hypothetical protein [Patescibacteria group bacterium]